MDQRTGYRSDVGPTSATRFTNVEFAIIGGGFGGIGMAIALRQKGIHDFIILERSSRPGGVWRDNSYPGAGCDVPSHLYCFSFAPNPDWSRVFAKQTEIDTYIAKCVRDYDLQSHFRFASDVRTLVFDETAGRWSITLADEVTLSARFVISATGQLSQPAYPTIPGVDALTIPAFHSARWRHDLDLAGKCVAIVGTGASAIQFVPPVAEVAKSVTIFQRSAPYVIPRNDRPYTAREKTNFRRKPWRMRLHRLRLYLQYEVRALLFTAKGGVLRRAVDKSFREMLAADVRDSERRRQLTPDYPVGCKRILISDEYLKSVARSNVKIVSNPIACFTPTGIRTSDGRERDVDAIIFGTGFKATSFLSPMKVLGRFGVELNTAWRDGAAAYLGITVPGFPNFFILYGPNTNLGHNSIIFMLETQIAHVMRCLDEMRRRGADLVEVRALVHEKADAVTQAQLKRSTWSGCKSWYVDASGRNTTNLPGFTFAYRRRAKQSSLDAYRFSVAADPGGVGTRILPPTGMMERLGANAARTLLRSTFRIAAGPPFPVQAQRRVLAALGGITPAAKGVDYRVAEVGGVTVEIVSPKNQRRAGAVLYLHGGAFCVGDPKSFRAVTSRLAEAAGVSVWVPDYRLAPEHLYPAAILDAVEAWEAIRAAGIPASGIVIAGDSAGGALAIALTLRVRARGEEAAGLALISPVVDLRADVTKQTAGDSGDPVIRPAWLQQCLKWYAAPSDTIDHRVLEADLSGLPPTLIQVGTDEVLHLQSLELARRAVNAGVDCRLEIHDERWHDFHLQAATLISAADAVSELGRFAAIRLDGAAGETAHTNPTIVRPAAERILAS